MTSSRLFWIVPVAALSVALTGCGGSSKSASNKVASLGGATTTTAAKSGTASGADLQQALLDYAKCMRKNGVNMPDPQFDANGRPQFNQGQGNPGAGNGGPNAGLRNDPDFEKAQTKCQSIRDSVRQQFQPSAEQAAQLQKSLLAFAKCMRGEGVDYPDPQFDSSGRPVFNRSQQNNATRNQSDPKFSAAQTKCRAQLGDTGFGRGFGGPGGPGGPGGRGDGGGSTPTTKASS